jgi:hypothetical protein
MAETRLCQRREHAKICYWPHFPKQSGIVSILFLEWVEMQAGQPITEPDKPILNLYFPFDAVTSTTQEMGNGSSSKRRPKYQTTVFTGMENTTPHVSPSTAARRIPGTNSGKPTAG